jgi:hypothetical protein
MGIHFGNRPTGNLRYELPPDPFFNQTVLLLNGDGTNGAQNNTFVDGSTNNFTITRNGNTTQGTFTPFSQPAGYWSNFFDGTGDSLSFSTDVSNTIGTNNLTIEAWIYPQIGSGAIFAGVNNTNISSVTSAITVEINSSGFARFRCGASTENLVTSTTVPLNQWSHFAAVRSGGVLKIFLNGTEIGSFSGTASNITGYAANAIGAVPFSTATNLFNGYISNLRVVNGTALYTSNFTPSTTPLTAITNTSLLSCQDNRFRDGSSNNFAITRNGDVRVTAFSPFAPTAAYSPTVNGGSGYFDGTGDYLTFTKNTTTSSFTLEAFVYPTTAAQQWVFGGDGTVNSTNNVQFRFDTSAGTIEFILNGAAVFTVTSTFVPINAWSHIVFARSGSSCAIFLNGVRVGTGTSTAALNVNRVGAYSTTFVFNGYISNARMVNADVYGVGNTTYTVPTAPLTAITNTYLLLNFTNAGIIDNTGKNVLETVGNAQIDTTVKKYGTGSMEFDGNGDYLFTSPNELFTLGTENYTIEFWIYFNSVAANQLIIGNYPAGVNYGWAFFTPSSGVLSYYLSSTGSSWNIASAVTIGNISTGTWYHVAFVRNGSTFTPYFNGVAGTTTTSSASIFGTNPQVYIAGNTGGGPFNGYIDDLRITRGVARYTTNFTPPTEPYRNF